MGFVIRTKKPEKGNKYYIRKVNGGYSDAIKGYPTDEDCDVLSNCVGYAYGRFNEIGGYGYCKYLAPVNAENFLTYKGECKTGWEPKLGACMVWQCGKSLSGNDGAGHVAIVERVISETEVFTSESGYGYKPFWNQTRKKGKDGNWGENDSYKFLGFIYNPAVCEEKSTELFNGKNIIRITTVELHVREYPTLCSEVVGFTNEGRYYYYETKESDGYTWYRIGDKQWIAYRPEWAVVESSETMTKEEITVGSLVSIKSTATYYDGQRIPDWVKNRYWFVKAIDRDKVFVDKSADGLYAINSPIKEKYLELVSDSNPQKNIEEYKVKVTASMLNIREGAGTDYRIVGCIVDKGIYSIVDEDTGKGADKWGKLKSGLGWISLDFTERLNKNE